MNNKTLYIIYLFMAATGLLAVYSLLTNGSPTSLLRGVLPDPRADWYVAIGCSFLFFVLGFFPFHFGQDKNFRQVVEMNAHNIRDHRRRGKSDQEIATSILSAMETKPGYRYNMAHKKLVYYLSQFR